MTAFRVTAFSFSQERLVQVLGVDLATLGDVWCKMLDLGVIHYSGGAVTIADRAALEGMSCRCYGSIRKASVLSL